MRILKHDSALATAISPALADHPFTLIDVGCLRGIAHGWRSFEPNLRGVGFDAKVDECERLAAIETNPQLRYAPAFVSIAPDHPFALKRGAPQASERNFWPRLSVVRTRANQTASPAAEPPPALADADDPVVLSDYFETEGFASIDVIKIDVDGPDYEILVSIEEDLARRQVIGLGVEVAFWGDASDTGCTFHNIDRFLRAQGYELFNISTHRYSAAALPDRYRNEKPNETLSGRLLFGDALYARDLAAPDQRDLALRYGPHKLLKLAAVFDLFDLADCAAEVLVAFRDEIAATGADPSALLDLLTRQRCKKLGLPELSYEAFLARFDADDDAFYAQRRQRP